MDIKDEEIENLVNTVIDLREHYKELNNKYGLSLAEIKKLYTENDKLKEELKWARNIMSMQDHVCVGELPY